MRERESEGEREGERERVEGWCERKRGILINIGHPEQSWLKATEGERERESGRIVCEREREWKDCVRGREVY